MNIHLRNVLLLILLIISTIGFVVGDDTRTIVIYGVGSFLMFIVVIDAFYNTYFAKDEVNEKCKA